MFGYLQQVDEFGFFERVLALREPKYQTLTFFSICTDWQHEACCCLGVSLRVGDSASGGKEKCKLSIVEAKRDACLFSDFHLTNLSLALAVFAPPRGRPRYRTKSSWPQRVY
jgi:hypothetical protein